MSIRIGRDFVTRKLQIIIALPHKEDGRWHMSSWHFIKLPF